MIEINNIIKTYGVGESAVHAVKGVSHTIPKDDFIVILGASGSGKSTLLHIISGLERPSI